MDVGNAIHLAGLMMGYGVTFSDASALYAAYSGYKQSGRLDLAGLQKAGVLARVSTAVAHVLADPVEAPKLVGLIASIAA